MNTFFRSEPETKGARFSFSLVYHQEKNENFELILKRLVDLVVKEFSQKPIYGEFEAEIPADLSIDTIEKELLEKEVTLSQYQFDKNDIKFEVTNGANLRYPSTLTTAMKTIFNIYYDELKRISLINLQFAGDPKTIKRKKGALRNTTGLFADYAHEAYYKIICSYDVLGRREDELKEQLQVFDKEELKA